MSFPSPECHPGIQYYASTFSMSLWNVAEVLQRPNSIIVNLNNPSCVVNALESVSMPSCQYPDTRSRVEKNLVPSCKSSSHLYLGKRKYIRFGDGIQFMVVDTKTCWSIFLCYQHYGAGPRSGWWLIDTLIKHCQFSDFQEFVLALAWYNHLLYHAAMA